MHRLVWRGTPKKGKVSLMRTGLKVLCVVALFALAPAFGSSEPTTSGPAPEPPTVTSPTRKTTTPGKQIGRGGEDIGKGVAKGTGALAKGTAGSVAGLAHGNFAGAGASLGRGAVGMGKEVTVGSAKGVAKIGKGLGGEFKKIRDR